MKSLLYGKMHSPYKTPSVHLCIDGQNTSQNSVRWIRLIILKRINKWTLHWAFVTLLQKTKCLPIRFVCDSTVICILYVAQGIKNYITTYWNMVPFVYKSRYSLSSQNIDQKKILISFSFLKLSHSFVDVTIYQ